MRFSADCSFQIGAQHLRSGLPCQDYALAGTTKDGRAYGIVSDGCSSGRRTDIGARVICLEAEETITFDFVAGKNHFVDRFLTFEDMLATRLSLIATQDRIHFSLEGDGVIAVSCDDDSMTMFCFEWEGNRPCYPVYETDGFNKFLGTFPEGSTPFSMETRTFMGTREVYGSIISVVPQLKYTTHIETHHVKAAAIFSDGVTQIDGIPWYDAVRQLMHFKSTEGDFVKRRLNRFLTEVRKTGRGHIDDIAMAAVMIRRDP